MDLFSNLFVDATIPQIKLVESQHNKRRRRPIHAAYCYRPTAVARSAHVRNLLSLVAARYINANTWDCN